jgi:protein gp37
VSGNTKIEWAEKVWNPVRGCTRVSEGCRNCYAERVAARFSGPGQPYEGVATMHNVDYARHGQPLKIVKEARWTGKIVTVPEALGTPLRWRKPARIFVNSMSDLFHEGVPDEFIDRIYGVMCLAKQHQFLILTKRPKRALEYLKSHLCVMRWGYWAAKATHDLMGGEEGTLHTAVEKTITQPPEWPPKNIWLGVSVEDQATADARIPLLLATPAAVRWVSYEPALGLVDFHQHLPRKMALSEIPGHALNDGCTEGKTWGLDWIVAGGESGPGARPAHPDWFRVVRDQCAAAGVPFFFKQWGEWAEVNPGKPDTVHEVEKQPLPIDLLGCFLSRDGHAVTREEDMRRGVKYRWMHRTGKKSAGRMLDGREHSEYPTS